MPEQRDSKCKVKWTQEEVSDIEGQLQQGWWWLRGCADGRDEEEELMKEVGGAGPLVLPDAWCRSILGGSVSMEDSGQGGRLGLSEAGLFCLRNSNRASCPGTSRRSSQVCSHPLCYYFTKLYPATSSSELILFSKQLHGSRVDVQPSASFKSEQFQLYRRVYPLSTIVVYP